MENETQLPTFDLPMETGKKALTNEIPIEKQYFTFGQSHFCPETGTPLKDYWIEINNKTSNEARQIMFDNFGDKWAFQYDRNNFKPFYFPKGCYKTFN